MANIFLDTNYVIDAFHRKPEKEILTSLEGHIIIISTLSLHIYCYVLGINIPEEQIINQIRPLTLLDFSQEIAEKALHGPTSDFEDNVQLHSGIQAQCDIFLTHDKALLRMGIFGDMKIKETMADG